MYKREKDISLNVYININRCCCRNSIEEEMLKATCEPLVAMLYGTINFNSILPHLKAMKASCDIFIFLVVSSNALICHLYELLKYIETCLFYGYPTR